MFFITDAEECIIFKALVHMIQLIKQCTEFLPAQKYACVVASHSDAHLRVIKS